MSAESILKSSAQKDKEVLATQIAFGEIALNYHETGPFLQCKDRNWADLARWWRHHRRERPCSARQGGMVVQAQSWQAVALYGGRVEGDL